MDLLYKNKKKADFHFRPSIAAPTIVLNMILACRSTGKYWMNQNQATVMKRRRERAFPKDLRAKEAF